MTKGKLRFIVFLISLALLFLIGTQSYWIKNSYSISEHQLAEEVYKAMNLAIGVTIESKYNSITKRIQASALVRTLDEMQKKLYKTNSNVQILFSELSVNNESLLSTDSVLIRIFSSFNLHHVDNPSEELEDLMKQLETTKQKKVLLEMLKDDEIQKISQIVLNQFDYELIDSALKSELKKVDKIEHYVFGIFEEEREEFIIISDPEMSDEFFLSEKTFSRPILLSEDVSGSRNYLLKLRILGQKGVLLMRMLPALLVSFLLVSIVASGYYFTISTILKQKRLSEIKTDFINNMTHEFKTPIANISLSLEALLNFGVLENRAKTEKYLSIAEKENARLSGMVEHVLKISLFENDNKRSKHEEIDIHQIIEKVISSLSIQIEDKKGAIKTDLKAQNNMIIGSYVDMSNVIFNLIDNGIKYSFGRKPNILVSTNSQNGHLNINVKDHGIGISKKYITKIFNKFFRVPTGNIQNAKGFGLGLSYVHHVVHQHGGKVVVESEPGKGSEFIITVPLERT